ncbi:ROK family protein [Streptomyces sp. NPDC057099]|uniref:ROK family protein n=1 Tax=Streptomyces sp. NPDC057099 TaxID=3346019 RepID=UPI00363212CE
MRETAAQERASGPLDRPGLLLGSGGVGEADGESRSAGAVSAREGAAQASVSMPLDRPGSLPGSGVVREAVGEARSAEAGSARETEAQASASVPLDRPGFVPGSGVVRESDGEVRPAGAGSARDTAAQASASKPPAPPGSLLGVGVALPGPLDHGRGVLHRVTGFPEWDGFPLREALAERLGVPVVVDKDTNAAALGLAAGGEGGSFAYLHLGTGLGAGLVIGGTVHRGARTGAGEFGHQVIQLDGPPCTCGDRGCVEALCLGAVARGDTAEAARVLGAGAANLVGLLDIDVVLLGGRTVAMDPEAFVRGVGVVLEAWARRTGQEAVPVRVAPGGERVVSVGAAQMVLGPVFGRGAG